jgi:uncharacterized delta-60 repeat protein
MKVRSRIIWHLGLAASICFSLAANSFAIGFDSTFGTGGKFMTSFSDAGQPSSAGTDVFLQPSGRIVVVGQHQQQGTTSRTSGFALAGLTTAGILDGGFGVAGKSVSWNPDFHQFLTESRMSSDGAIFILYQRYQSAAMNRALLVKYTPSGQIDSNFLADIDIFPNQTTPVLIALGSGGKTYVLVRNGYQFSLIRLTDNGSRDTTFAPDGIRVLDLNRFYQPTVRSLTELGNGKLLVMGTLYQGFDGITFVARFDSDTNFDRSFGIQGITRLAKYGGTVNGNAMQVQTDGRILIGGSWTFLGSTTFLTRLTARGRIDYSFGSGGLAATSFNDWNVINSIAVSPDGKVIVAGGCGDKAVPSNQRLFIMRYSAAGVSESSLVTNFIGTREASASDVVLQSDGKMVIAGFTQNPADNFLQLSSARFLP